MIRTVTIVILLLVLLAAPVSAKVNRDMSLVHKDLQEIVKKVRNEINPLCPSGWSLEVFETYRTKERQRKLVNEGKSKTMNSKHCLKPTRAVDLVWKHNGNWTWKDPKLTNGKKGWAYLEELKKKYNLRIIRWDKPHLELK